MFLCFYVFGNAPLLTLFGRSALSLILLKNLALEWLALCFCVCMLRESAASKWLGLCLMSCVLDDAAPWLTDVANFFHKNYRQGDYYHLFPWLFTNLQQLVTLSGIVSKTEGICWLSHDCACIT